MSNQARTQLAATYRAVIRDDTVVNEKAAVLLHKTDEIRQAALLLDEHIRGSDDSEGVKKAHLTQVRQVLVIVDDAAKKGAEFFSRLPALYEALETVPWTHGARYRVDYNINLRPGDEYQVAARLQTTLSLVEHQAKADFNFIVANLTRRGVYPDTRLALRKFKELLITIMVRANYVETLKIREISPALVRDIGDAEDVLKWIGVW